MDPQSYLSFNRMPYYRIIGGGAIFGLALAMIALLFGQSLPWFLVYTLLVMALFYGGIRFGHQWAVGHDVAEKERFGIEFLIGNCFLVPAHLAGFFILYKGMGYRNPLAVVWQGALVGAAIGSLPLLLKLKWVYDGKNVLNNATLARQEAERLLKLDQVTDAEEKYRESILAHEVQFGTNHALTARQVVEFAQYLARIGEREKAVAMIRRALSNFESVLGPNAPEVAECVLLLVKSDPTADPETVLPLLRRAQVVRESQFGPESREVAEVCGYLGMAHYGAAKWNEAVEALRRGLTILEKLLPEESPERIQASGRLASAYVRASRPLEAEKLIRSTLALRQQLAMAPDGDYVQLLGDLATLQRRQNQAAEERRSLLEAVQVLVEHVGPTHPARDEILKAAVPYLADPLTPHAAALQAVVSADGMTVRKTCDTSPDITKATDDFGWTLLQWAVFLGHDRIVDTLLFNGSVTELPNTEWPPLQIALRWGNKRALGTLLQKGLVCGFQAEKGGWTALHRACQGGDDRNIDSLIQKGCSPSMVNADGDTPLHIAARLGHARVVVELMHHGSDGMAINEKTGRTPLHEAAYHGQRPALECIVLKLPPQALEMADGEGRTPAELAALRGHNDLAQYLSKLQKTDQKAREKEERAREKERERQEREREKKEKEAKEKEAKEAKNKEATA